MRQPLSFATWMLAQLSHAMKGLVYLAILIIVLSIGLHVTLPESRFVPGPSEFGASFQAMFLRGAILTHVMVSCFRVLGGFTLAFCIALCLAISVLSVRSLRGTLIPVNSFLRYVPPTAFTILLIGVFGVGEGYKIAAVFFGIVFFLLSMLVDAFDSVDRRYVEMGLVEGHSRIEIAFRIILPSTLPKIIDVARINLSAAWTFLVVAELVGAQEGLGYLVHISQRFGRVADVFLLVLVFGVIGWLFDAILYGLSRLVVPWHYALALSGRNL